MMNYDINKKKVKVISKLFSKYYFDDLCSAIMTLSLWSKNRSFMTFNLTIIEALLNTNGNGTERINNYFAFVNFYEALKKEFELSIIDDRLIHDSGQVYVKFHDDYVSTIIGTNYDYSFHIHLFIDYIYDNSKKKKELTENINFFDRLLKYTKNANSNDSNIVKENMTFSLPQRDFFDLCYKYYMKNLISENNIYFKDNQGKQKHRFSKHYVEFNSRYYYIFNPTYLVDIMVQEIIGMNKEELYFISYKSSLIESNKMFEKSNFASEILVVDELSSKVISNAIYYFEDKENCFILIPYSIDSKNISNAIANCSAKGNLLLVKIDANNRELVKKIEPQKKVVCIFQYMDLSFITGSNIKIADNINIISVYEYMFIIHYASYKHEVVDFLNDIFIKKTSFNVYNHRKDIMFILWFKKKYGFIEVMKEDTIISSIDPYLCEREVFDRMNSDYLQFPFQSNSKVFQNHNIFKYIEENGIFSFFFQVDKYDYPNKYYYIYSHDQKHYIGIFVEYKIMKNDFNYNIMFDVLHGLITEYQEILGRLKSFIFHYTPKNEISKDKDYIKRGKYVYSMFSDSELVFYVVDSFWNDIANAVDRNIEIIFLEELIDIFNINQIKEEIEQDRSKNKITNIFNTEINYYFSKGNNVITFANYVDIEIKKIIASTLDRLKVSPQIFRGEEGVKIIRKIQDDLIPIYEDYVSRFDKLDMHCKVLSNLGAIIQNKNVHMMRIHADNTGMRENNFEEVLNKITPEREILRKYESVANYLIESNLSLERKKDLKIDTEDLLKLFSFSSWMYDIQEVSDILKWELQDISLKVDWDYKLEIIYEDNDSYEFSKRTYKYGDYKESNHISNEEYEMLNEAHIKDTGINLSELLTILSYLEFEGGYDYEKYSVYDDVFYVNRKLLVDGIENFMSHNSIFQVENIDHILEYLTIDTTQIKTTKKGNEEKKHRLIPSWEKSYRENSFELKPLFFDQKVIIYSPVVINQFKKNYFGMINGILPANKNLVNTIKMLNRINQRIESEFEIDVYNLFDNINGIHRFKSLKLHKYDKRFPNDLGDYDVFVIDNENFIIWNLECKVIGFKRSVFEVYSYQKSFFSNHKNDHKFSRRVDYLKRNTKDILFALGIDNDSTYSIRNIMLTSKNFKAFKDKMDFELVSFNELKTLLDYYKN